ncbi:TIGR03086 family metal-binding protein [Nonomuraea sp. NPDC046802]|uniref:TIGR03086 family metal-binding protein n=1 Tax=Nonomuraea sp. NPDC046802 TaxID=3154919 RepID=UPI003405F3FC
MSETTDRYRRRADAFERTVVAVRPDQWANPSPCEKWTARDVVRHIVEMHAAMLHPLGRSLGPAPSMDEDPVAAFRAARADVEAILNDPALASRTCDTPTGPVTAEQHIDQVVSEDLPLHGWDLARATGQDDTIDPEDVERAWAGMRALPAELVEKFRTPGAFGPDVEVFGSEVKVAQDASPQDKLLAFIGRDPHWRP